MSLTINIATPEGLVLAADSRQSYRNMKNQSRVGSDSAMKVIQLSSKVGVTLAGPAFLPEDGVLKNVSEFVEEYKNTNDIESMDIEEIAKGLKDFFEKRYPYQEELSKLPDQIKEQMQAKGFKIIEMTTKENSIEFSFLDKESKVRKGTAGVDSLSILVAGYNQDSSHQVYIAYVPGPLQEKRNSRTKEIEYGASWTGQTDVVARVVLGRDPRFTPTIMQSGLLNTGVSNDQVVNLMRNFEYIISWGTMSLQDAIDFCRLMIETTSAIQRYSDGIAMDPGDIPGVGGPIDIAIITRDHGFVWINKKKLLVGDNATDLDALPKILSIRKPVSSDNKTKSHKTKVISS